TAESSSSRRWCLGSAISSLSMSISRSTRGRSAPTPQLRRTKRRTRPPIEIGHFDDLAFDPRNERFDRVTHVARQQSLFVGKVIVQCPDRNPGVECDGPRRDSGPTSRPPNPNKGVVNGLNREFRATLQRPLDPLVALVCAV